MKYVESGEWTTHGHNMLTRVINYHQMGARDLQKANYEDNPATLKKIAGYHICHISHCFSVILLLCLENTFFAWVRCDDVCLWRAE